MPMPEGFTSICLPKDIHRILKYLALRDDTPMYSIVSNLVRGQVLPAEIAFLFDAASTERQKAVAHDN